MKIESDRLLLEEISWDDLQDVHHIHSLPEIDEFNTLGIPKDLDETRQVMLPDIEYPENQPRKSYCWRITLKESEKFIGLAGMFLSRDKFRLGEIYYKILPEDWGKGFATEVCKAQIRFGFEEMNLHKIEAGVAVGNDASIRVLQKSGMTREGLRRKILPIRGKWKDNYHFAIVEDDPRGD